MLPFELAYLMLHACKKSRWVTGQNFEIKTLLFPVTFISGMRDFMGHLTSGILCVRHILEIWIHSADACPLAVSCVGYTCVAKNPFKPP